MFRAEVTERQWLTMHACHSHTYTHTRTSYGRTYGRYSRPRSRRVRGIKDEHVRRSRHRGKSPTGTGSHIRRALLTYFKLSILFNVLLAPRPFSCVASLHSCTLYARFKNNYSWYHIIYIHIIFLFFNITKEPLYHCKRLSYFLSSCNYQRKIVRINVI